MSPRLILIFLFSTLSAARCDVSFTRQIAPIFLEKCVACHGPEKTKGGYRLDSFSALAKPGDSRTPPILVGSSAKSHLFALITTSDEADRMPQKGDPLTANQIENIRNWIDQGAKFDGTSPDKPLAAIIPFQPGPEAPARYPFPQPVLALAWSPDGKLLATSGYHEVLLWETTGKLAQRLNRLPQRIHALAFLDENKIALAAGTPGKSGEVLICATNSTNDTPQLLLRLADEVIALAVNRERTLLVAGGSDNAVHLFELPGGRELFAAQQHADWVTSLAFSPDGSKIASASRDRTARILETKSGNLLETYPDHAQALYAVAFSADGKRAFSGGRERKPHAWQTSDGKKNGEFPSLEGDVLALCVVGSSLFVSGNDKRIREFNSDDRKEIRSLTGHSDWIYSLALHEPTKRLASGSYDGEVRIWDLEKGESVATFKASP